MQELLQWHHSCDISLAVLAEFHARIHPFQDGNGRTGRLILFRGCLINRLVPLIIMDETRMEYLYSLAIAKLIISIHRFQFLTTSLLTKKEIQ